MGRVYFRKAEHDLYSMNKKGHFLVNLAFREI